MTRAAEKVLKAALALSKAERAEVAARLEESLGGFETPEIAQAWEKEIAERIRAIEAHEVDLLTEDEVNNRLRAKYGPLFD